MNLADFINRHAGETAWLFGKGPSLSDFDFKTAGPLRCVINELALHVPSARYCFANDGVQAWRDAYIAGQVLFQPRRALCEYDSTQPEAVKCEVVAYEDARDDQRIFLPPAECAELLSIRRGTLGSALQILRIMGVKTVCMVGFDGGNAHAPGYEWRTRLRSDHWKDYEAIKSDAIDYAELVGMSLQFHNSINTMTTDGKIWVRLTRDCFAECVPYGQGSIAKFTPRIARELIESDSAEAYSPPAREQIETATAPVAAAETAAIATPKAGKSRRK